MSEDASDAELITIVGFVIHFMLFRSRIIHSLVEISS